MNTVNASFESLNVEGKLSVINDAMRELTFYARYSFSDERGTREDLFHITEMINRLCGYVDYLLSGRSDGDETLFRQMACDALETIHGSEANRLRALFQAS